MRSQPKTNLYRSNRYCARANTYFSRALDNSAIRVYNASTMFKLYLFWFIRRLVYVTFLIIMCAYLQACAVYTVASTASFVTTNKSIGDHVLSNAIPNADCTIANVVKDKYYCEVTDLAKTYNRNGI